MLLQLCKLLLIPFSLSCIHTHTHTLTHTHTQFQTFWYQNPYACLVSRHIHATHAHHSKYWYTGKRIITQMTMNTRTLPPWSLFYAHTHSVLQAAWETLVGRGSALRHLISSVILFLMLWFETVRVNVAVVGSDLWPFPLRTPHVQLCPGRKEKLCKNMYICIILSVSDEYGCC